MKFADSRVRQLAIPLAAVAALPAVAFSADPVTDWIGGPSVRAEMERYATGLAGEVGPASEEVTRSYGNVETATVHRVKWDLWGSRSAYLALNTANGVVVLKVSHHESGPLLGCVCGKEVTPDRVPDSVLSPAERQQHRSDVGRRGGVESGEYRLGYDY